MAVDKKALMEKVGSLGGAMVSAYAGYMMTQFAPKAELGYEKQLAPLVKLGGWLLMGFALYDVVRGGLARQAAGKRTT